MGKNQFVICKNALTGIVILWFFAVPFTFAADKKVEEFTISPIQPRSFGLLIGDKFMRTIDFQLHKPYALDARSLPSKGRITPWLTLDAPIIEQQETATSTHYHIQLNYQIVNIKPDIHYIDIPGHFLTYVTAKEISRLLVPAAKVGVSALINNAQKKLQPDKVPELLPQYYFRSIVAGSFLFISLSGLALLYWGLPFSGKTRPFAAVCQKLSKLHTKDENSYSEALKSIHQAFNETAGKIIFAEKLDNFFNENTHYIPLRSEIENYFEHSRKYFFEDEKADTGNQYSVLELRRFIKECRNIERSIL